MKELLEKYAEVLLKSCLKVEKDQPLLISGDMERIDFIRILEKKALEMGVKDIYFDISDPYLKHEALKNLEVEDLKKLTFWNREIWNVYAKKKAAFLMLTSQTPGLMKDIDPKKMSAMTKYGYETRKEFDDMRDKSELAWCIAAVPTLAWAKELYPNSSNQVEELWNKIFEICGIKEENPTEIWNEKINKLKVRADKLTNYEFQFLKYESSNGTNLKIGLPKNHRWASGNERLANGKEVLVNFPTEEVFTSPDCLSAEGIVYSSKPLSYQGTIIDEFNISFKEGKVVEVHAKKGEEALKAMVDICENSNMLGEVALVPYDSPISNCNQVFLETLFDENAACHLALGDSFTECIENGSKIDKKELFEEYHLNKCDSHVDFMIGTKDLKITGITKDNKEIEIFRNGNFTEEFN